MCGEIDHRSFVSECPKPAVVGMLAWSPKVVSSILYKRKRINDARAYVVITFLQQHYDQTEGSVLFFHLDWTFCKLSS